MLPFHLLVTAALGAAFLLEPTPMKMSAIGRAALESREGVRLTAYKDSVGIWTIGVGHTAACGAPIPAKGVTITAEEADACFARDLEKFERAITAAIKVPVAQHEFDALVSLAFNVGAGGAAGSTAVRRLNAGDRAGAAEAILKWNKPAEIIDRRQAERDQFLTPYSTALPKGRRSDKGRVKAVGSKPDQVAAAPVAQAKPAPAPAPTPPPVKTGSTSAAPAKPPQGGFFVRLIQALTSKKAA